MDGRSAESGACPHHADRRGLHFAGRSRGEDRLAALERRGLPRRPGGEQLPVVENAVSLTVPAGVLRVVDTEHR